MSRFRFKAVLGAAFGALGFVGTPSSAQACGGFFCSQSQPVNQAAERIVFADNGDGTVTAVIQILYEGPSESFSWLLPISTVPVGDQIAVASNVAFQRLQAATNPSYTLTTVVEGECKPGGPTRGVPVSATGSPDSSTGGDAEQGGGVTVEASGVVGAFEWAVISLDQSLADPAAAAVGWLAANGYDVPAGAPALLGPYLEEGLYLLALRLTKDAGVGSIRPIVLTYDAHRPAIPIKLTQVAANDDMGVLTWVLGPARAVPQNYLSLELNEARINWFNASTNYNDVVIAAANDTGTGQGFVTEYSQPGQLGSAVFSGSDLSNWQAFRAGMHASLGQMFTTAAVYWGSWDGFWDAARSTIELPQGVTWEDVQSCPSCYAGEFQFSPSEFLGACEAQVIEPVQLVQRLLDSAPHVTRLYTTLSAAEMTLDPIFTFNPDLEPVSNLHTATRYVECDPTYFAAEAPWRVVLPQGGVVRGPASTNGSLPAWPDAVGSQPANLRITQAAEQGDGRVLEDNQAVIESMLSDYNATTQPDAVQGRSSGGCSLGGAPKPAPNGAAWFGLGVLLALRRRRQIWPKGR